MLKTLAHAVYARRVSSTREKRCDTKWEQTLLSHFLGTLTLAYARGAGRNNLRLLRQVVCNLA